MLGGQVACRESNYIDMNRGIAIFETRIINLWLMIKEKGI